MKSVIFYFSLLFSALISFYSCKKDVSSGESESSKFTIEEARTWFTKEAQPRNSSSKISKTFTVLWTTARTSEDNKHFVMECHLKFDQTPGFLVKDSGKQISAYKQINGDIRLVLLKSKTDNEIRAFLMNMYSNTGSILEKNSYCNVDKDFDGFVFFTDLEGRFVNGWQYHAGNIIRSSKADGKSKKSNSSLIGAFVQPVDECGWVQFDTYQRTCFYQDDTEIGCTEWQFMYSELRYFCNDGGGGGGTGEVQYDYVTTAIESNTVVESFTEEPDRLYGTQSIDPITHAIKLNARWEWICGKGSTLWLSNYYNWSCYSYETGELQKAHATDLWQIQTLTHSSIQRIGQTAPSHEYTHELAYAVSNIADDKLTARMDIKFVVYERIAGLTQTKSWAIPNSTICVAN
jgi:hypothetical protein